MTFGIILFALTLGTLKAQSACDDSVTLLRNSFGYYLSQAYNPPQVDLLWDKINSIRACVDTIYLLCYNISPIDWSSKYTPNSGNCLLGLRNTSDISAAYGSQPQSKFLSDLTLINDVVKQAMSDCREILKSTEYENLTIPCNQSASNLNSLLSQYTDERMLGGSGEEFLGQIALALVKQRRECGFRTVVNPNYNSMDNCSNSNDFMGYVADFMENYLDKGEFYNYYRYYRFYFQVAVRANNFCSGIQ